MLVIQEVSKRYGTTLALAPTSLTIPQGQTMVLLGTSGSGKSTLLRMLCGLITPDQGQIMFQGQPIRDMESFRQQLGYVIQEGGLFPHLTCADNITLLARYLKQPVSGRLDTLAQLLQLPVELLQKYPRQLSGGQRQRVALLRALFLDPPLLLLDEPLGALDPITRNELQTQLRQIFLQLQKTVVLVTHDLGEAAYLGDVLVLMHEGQILQQGTFKELTDRPSSPYVREFLQAQRPPMR